MPNGCDEAIDYVSLHILEARCTDLHERSSLQLEVQVMESSSTHGGGGNKALQPPDWDLCRVVCQTALPASNFDQVFVPPRMWNHRPSN